MEIFWLGVAGIWIKNGDDGDILIDPYASGNQSPWMNRFELEQIESKIVTNTLFDRVKLIIGTHNHYDHVDDISYIWSRWSGAGRDISVVVPEATKRAWQKRNWRRQIDRWSDNRSDELMKRVITLAPKESSIFPDITPCPGCDLVEDGKIKVGSLEITFVKQYHSDLPGPFEAGANREGNYALSVVDTAFTGDAAVSPGDRNGERSVNCGSAFILCSSGLPVDTLDEKPWNIDYSKYEFPREFDHRFQPQWLFEAVRHEVVHEKILNRLDSLTGVTPIHWDRGAFLCPPRKVGKVTRMGLRSIRKFHDLTPGPLHYVRLRNTLRYPLS